MITINEISIRANFDWLGNSRLDECIIRSVVSNESCRRKIKHQRTVRRVRTCDLKLQTQLCSISELNTDQRELRRMLNVCAMVWQKSEAFGKLYFGTRMKFWPDRVRLEGKILHFRVLSLISKQILYFRRTSSYLLNT